MTARQLLMDLWLMPHWRRFRKARWDERSRYWVLALGAAAFLGILYGIFKPILRSFVASEMVGELLVSKLVYVFLSVIFVILLLSNFIGMLGRFVLDEESELLLSSPLDPAALYRFKFWQAAIASGWMVLPLWLPLLLALRKAYNAGPGYVAWGLLAVVPLTLLAAAPAAGLLLGILRWVPAGLLRRILGVTAAVFGCGLVVVLRVFQPERLANPEAAVTFAQAMENLKIPEPVWNPATHAAMSVMRWESDPGSALGLVAVLFLAAGLVYILSERFGAPRFHGLWLLARELENSGRGERKGPAKAVGRRFRWGGPLTALVVRQLLAIVRNPSNRVQMLFLSVLTAIFLYSVQAVRFDEIEGLRSYIFGLACGLSQLVVLAVGARFFYPLASMDTKIAWVELSSPASTATQLAARYLPVVLFLMAFNLAIFAAVGSMIRPSVNAWKLGFWVVVTSTLMTSSLIAGLGMAWSSADVKQPDQAVTSAAGVMMTVIAFSAAVGNAVFSSWFVYAWSRVGLVKRVDDGYAMLVVLAVFWGMLFLSALLMPIWLAKRRLERWDF